jgi:hypothetical protein
MSSGGKAYREDGMETVKKEPVRIDPGEKRPADQFRTDLFGRPLVIGGRYEIEPRYTMDRRLDPRRADDVANVDQDLQIEMYYRWSPAVSAFLQASAFYNTDVYAEDRKPGEEGGVQLKQAWLFLNRLFDSDFSLQLGRQRFADRRQWWWNEELDAGRFYFATDGVFAELAIAQEISSKRTDQGYLDPLHKNVLRILGDVAWQWDEKQSLSLFVLSQLDGSRTQTVGETVYQERSDVRDADLTWVGARAMGKTKLLDKVKFGYWLDAAVVAGRETTLGFDDIDDRLTRVESRARKDVLGWGLDIGLTWYSKLPLEPYFTLGYARGSGDSDPNDGTDRSYRQSGIHNNKVKFSGSQRFRYYGELFKPELSNLDIKTVAVGVPLSEESSIDLLYHHYEQAVPARTIRDTRIRANTTGESGDIGDELDLVLSLDEWEHFQVQLVGSAFRAGNAYGELAGKTSAQFFATVKYSF